MERKRRHCLAHAKDVDGIASASLVKMATGADVSLTDYSDLIASLRDIDHVDELYICDLGMNETLFKDFLFELRRISKTGYVQYIDHHPLGPPFKRRLRDAGVHLFHSRKECSAVLAYSRFEKALPKDASLVAAYAAVTDYMDSQPIASKIIDGYDRQYVLLEATMLSYAISRKGGDRRYLLRLVDGLSKLEPPHRIMGVAEYAAEHAERMAILMEQIKRKGVRMKKLAYFESTGATGNVANFLIGTFKVPVGVAYRHKRSEGVTEISVRGSMDFKGDLGSMVSEVAKEVGGNGGGHPKASGARIPESGVQDFIRQLDARLAKG